MNVVIPTIKWDKLPGETEYIANQRVHVGRYTSDFKLSEHFNLSVFKRDGEYRVSEYLIERLEAMFLNFTLIKGKSVASAYRLWQPGNYLSQHQLGCAVDIAWLDEDGNTIDAKYLAPAAVWCGFGGVACLEKPDGSGGWYANSLHMDVRHDHAGTCWYGYERDPNFDGWFDSFTISNKYGNPQAFYDRYNITEASVVAYLGGISVPKVLRMVVLDTKTTEATFKILYKSEDSITKLNYALKDSEGNELEGSISESKLTHTETSVSFKLDKLVPGTEYLLKVEFEKGDDTITVPALRFATQQSYPKAASISDITTVKNKVPVVDTVEYTANYSVPSNFSCYWDEYWTKNRYPAGDYKGYDLVLIADGKIIKFLTKGFFNIIKLIPAEHGIKAGQNLQFGIQTWIKTNKKINSSEYETITSDICCTAPVVLEGVIPLIKRLYIKTPDGFIQTMISALKDG